MIKTTAVDTTRADQPTTHPPKPRGRMARLLLEPSKLHLVLIVMLLATTLAALVWRSVSVHALERQLGAARTQARAEMSAHAGELLKLTAIPLAWAIRAGVVAN